MNPGSLPPGERPGYLIVTPQRLVDGNVFDEFAYFKRGLGFDVSVATLEAIAATTLGRDLPEQIREYLKHAYQANTSRPANVRYVLLVGEHEIIPFRQIYPRWESADNPGGLTFTDWYYADLTGDWDSNGDGLFGQGVLLNHPTDAADLHYDVAVGRLPFSTEALVQHALEQIVAAENDGGIWKMRSLNMGAFMEFTGRVWTPRSDPAGHYEDSGDKIGTDTDNAVLMERIWEDILRPNGMSRTRIYETTLNPLGQPHSAYAADYALSEQGVIDAWSAQSHGLVNVAGHGASSVVAQYRWQWERLANGILEFPTEPIDIGLGEVRSYNEMRSAVFLHTGTLPDLASPGGTAPVVAIAGCGTAGFDDPEGLGVNFLALGRASAFFGSLGTTGYERDWRTPTSKGSMQDVLYRFNLLLLGGCPRVGDATYCTLMQLYDETLGEPRGRALVKHLLYGDPAMSYWGNGAAFDGPWPMFRHDSHNSGRTTYSGPAVPEIKWTFRLNPGDFVNGTPSPIVGADGTIYAGSATGRLFAVHPNGEEKWHFDAGAAINAAPTLTVNGTLYFRVEDGYLYALADDGGLRWRMPVEYVAGSAGPTQAWPPFANSPRVSSDGTVYALAVPTNNLTTVLNAYRPTGHNCIQTETANGGAVATPALGPDGTLYIATWDGRLFAYGPDVNQRDGIVLNATVLGSPAIGRDGTTYVGTTAGRLYAIGADMHERWHFDATHDPVANINGSPAIGEDGSVYFGSWDNWVYALESDGALRWQFNAGGPVDSSPALDAATVYVVGGPNLDARVFAIDRVTGVARWAVPIGGRALWGSSLAIGYDQTVYVVASTGQLIAIGPYRTLPAPSAASASAISSHEVDLRWRDNGITGSGFSVERRTGFRGDFKSIATLAGGSTSYRDASVRPNHLYFYRVRALASAPSGYSNETRVRTPRPMPKRVGAVKAQANSAYSIRVSWSGLDANALGVAIYRAPEQSGPFRRIGIARAGTSSFLDVNPKVVGVESGPPDGDPRPRHTYYYQLRAFNAGGESPASTTATGKTRGLDLTAPTGLAVKVLSGSRVRVSWQNQTTGHDGLVIERSSDTRAGFEALATLPAIAHSFEETTEPGWIVYRVRAVSAANDSPFATAEPVYMK